MAKYIDTEKLIALIDAKLEDLGMSGSVWVGRSVLQELKNDIISLQQEQKDILVLNKNDWEKQEQFRKDKKFGLPLQQEQPEVDFEKAYKSYMESRKDDLSGNAVTVNMKDLARHFYELGLNARKED